MDLKESLKEFLESIENQAITLKHIDFHANPNIEGKFEEKQIKRELELNKVEVTVADVCSGDDKKGRAIMIECHGCYKDSLLSSEDKQLNKEDEIIQATFEYVLKLHIKDESIFFKVREKERDEILKTFINTTGKLILYPYIRHILHMLTLEAGFNLPPIKPIMIK